MALVIIGVVLGAAFGAAALGYNGWILGAAMGGLAGLVLKQIQKIGLLETTVKILQEEQLKTNHQLNQLKNNLQAAPQTTSQAAKDSKPVETHKPIADAVNEVMAAKPIVTTKPIATPETESLELELPDFDLPEPSKPKATLPIPPVQPREPDLGDKIFSAVRRFITESNPIAIIGAVVIFLGISFLAKYAAGQGYFPIELRLTGIVFGAIALLVFGWKTRSRVGSYGLVLQGSGIAIIYLTLFAAAKLYGLIPLGIAFGLLFVVVILGVLLALLQNSQTLAILATAGGFLAPILTSTGSGSHVGLFSFYLILNLGILAIALKKAWRLLNWVGFMFTFVITAAWGVLKYEPVFYTSTQPFLIAFFTLYLVVSILFSFKQPTNLKGMVDGSLIFGLPLVAFGLQTTLLKHTEYGLAISAIVLSAIYISLSIGLSRRYLQTHRLLIESFLALGISFATLAIPLALDASWTSVTWALEATGLVWVGLRQNRLRPRVVGYLLHCAAACALVVVEGVSAGTTPLISGDFLNLILLSLSSLTIAYLLHVFSDRLLDIEKVVAPIAIACGVLWWFVAGINEMDTHVMDVHLFAAIILFSALSATAFMFVSKKLEWPILSSSLYALLPFMLLLFVVFTLNEDGSHPTQGFTWLALIAFFAVQYRFLFTKEQQASHQLLGWYHTFTAWGVLGLIFWEVSWQSEHYLLQGTADLMVWFAAILIPAVAIIGAGQKKFWPFNNFEYYFKNWIPVPPFLLAAFWFIAVCNETLPYNEPYLPLLNVLDLAQFAIVLMFGYATKREFMNAITLISNKVRFATLGLMLFVWVNVVTLRAVSHYQDISYIFDNLWDAAQIQMALSILWTMCALLLMNISRRIQRRELWVLGAGLLGVVILKLATKDLSGKDTLAGIISFMVVGGLMLLIGFLSPIPAKHKDSEAEEALEVDNKNFDSDKKDAAHE